MGLGSPCMVKHDILKPGNSPENNKLTDYEAWRQFQTVSRSHCFFTTAVWAEFSTKPNYRVHQQASQAFSMGGDDTSIATDTEQAAEYDLCVIGAGTSGVASARFYLDVHPNAKVVLLERDHSVGGVWSSGMYDEIATHISSKY